MTAEQPGMVRVMTDDMTRVHTPRRTVRIPDQLWRACQALADSRGETISDVVRRALHTYLETPK